MHNATRVLVSFIWCHHKYYSVPECQAAAKLSTGRCGRYLVIGLVAYSCKLQTSALLNRTRTEVTTFVQKLAIAFSCISAYARRPSAMLISRFWHPCVSCGEEGIPLPSSLRQRTMQMHLYHCPRQRLPLHSSSNLRRPITSHSIDCLKAWYPSEQQAGSDGRHLLFVTSTEKKHREDDLLVTTNPLNSRRTMEETKSSRRATKYIK